MAIELIRQIWCDGHLQSTGTHVEGVTIPPVTLPSGKQKVVDLCESCQKEIGYLLLIELADNFGREVETVKVKTSRKYTEPVHTEEERQCRFCNRVPFETRRGRIRHEQSMHAEQYSAAETEDSTPASEEPGDIEVKTTKRAAKKTAPSTN